MSPHDFGRLQKVEFRLDSEMGRLLILDEEDPLGQGQGRLGVPGENKITPLAN